MKKVAITVNLFEKGDLLHCSINGSALLATVLSDQKEGEKTVRVSAVTKDGRAYDDMSLATDRRIKLVTKKQYDKLYKTYPKVLRVKTLDRTLRVTKDYLIVGCQKISKADAQTIAKFILDNF